MPTNLFKWLLFSSPVLSLVLFQRVLQPREGSTRPVHSRDIHLVDHLAVRAGQSTCRHTDTHTHTCTRTRIHTNKRAGRGHLILVYWETHSTLDKYQGKTSEHYQLSLACWCMDVSASKAVRAKTPCRLPPLQLQPLVIKHLIEWTIVKCGCRCMYMCASLDPAHQSDRPLTCSNQKKTALLRRNLPLKIRTHASCYELVDCHPAETANWVPSSAVCLHADFQIKTP